MACVRPLRCAVRSRPTGHDRLRHRSRDRRSPASGSVERGSGLGGPGPGRRGRAGPHRRGPGWRGPVARSILPRVTFQTLSETDWAAVDEVWRRLEEGDVEGARAALEPLRVRRPGHPDVKIVEAAVALDDDEPGEALDALRGAERSADPALFFHLRALAEFDLVRFEDARADAERALAVQPTFAEAHDLLSRVLEHLGRDEDAAAHATEATRLDPELFPAPLDVDRERFDALVERSIAELPDKVRAHLDEVPVMVEDLPGVAVLTAEEPPMAPDILGLFVGRHLMERSVGDLPAAPGAIYLFRRNLLRACESEEDLVREVRITVQHEVGHLLGLDEDDLEQWGLA